MDSMCRRQKRRVAGPIIGLLLILMSAACSAGDTDQASEDTAESDLPEVAGDSESAPQQDDAANAGDPAGTSAVEPAIQIVALDDDSSYVASLCAVGPHTFAGTESPLTAFAAAVSDIATSSAEEADEKAELVRRIERVAEADDPDVRDVHVVGDILAARCAS